MSSGRGWIVLCWGFVGGLASATEVFIVPLHVFSEEPGVVLDERDLGVTQDLIDRLIRIDTQGMLVFRVVDRELIDRAPTSLVEVSRLAEALDVRLVVYGIVRKTAAFYDAELHLFDNVSKGDIAVFYAKSGVDAYELVPHGLAAQAAEFTRKFLGISDEQQAAQRRFGGMRVRIGGGYWLPYGRWAERTRGNATGSFGLQVIPTTPLIRRQSWQFALRLGMEIGYEVGEGVPGRIPSRLDIVWIDLPVDGCWWIRDAHGVCGGLAPSLRIDTATVQPLFKAQQRLRSTAVGVVLRMGYTYWMGGSRRVGLGTEVATGGYVYAPALFSVGMRAYVAVRMGADT